MYKLLRILLILCVGLFPVEAFAQYHTLIRGARVLDGSGNPWIYADVAINGDRIVAVGDLDGAMASFEVDATELYLAPGFIDSHSHAAEGLVAADRSSAKPLLAEGITTVVINPDGGGAVDLVKQQEALLRDGLGINVMQLVPHGTVRRQVMGLANRRPNSDELATMKTLVRQGMEAGAWGLSNGAFYAPGSFADTNELIELAKVAAAYGGVYTSHIRDESNYTIGVVAAVDEVIEVARNAKLPGIVTHIKVLGPPVWGFSGAIVTRIDRARAEGVEVYADQYPYIASATGLGAALVPRWAVAGGSDSLEIRMGDVKTMALIRQGMVENLARRGGADRIQFRSFSPDPSVEGRLLSEVARNWELDPIDAAIRMVQQGDAGIVSFNMNERDVATFMQQTWTMTSSDGAFPEWGNGVPHPRAFGAFPRKIRKYVIEVEIIDLPAAIRSMTSLPAQVFGLQDRGVIRIGAVADLVVFDLNRIRDKSTFTEPFQMAEGMVHVFVNGQPSWTAGNATDVQAGRVLYKR